MPKNKKRSRQNEEIMRLEQEIQQERQRKIQLQEENQQLKQKIDKLMAEELAQKPNLSKEQSLFLRWSPQNRCPFELSDLGNIDIEINEIRTFLNENSSHVVNENAHVNEDPFYDLKLESLLEDEQVNKKIRRLK